MLVDKGWEMSVLIRVIQLLFRRLRDESESIDRFLLLRPVTQGLQAM